MRIRPGAEIWLFRKLPFQPFLEVLLLRKKHGIFPAYWQPAAGGQESNERIETTAARELQEETGVQLTEDQLVMFFQNEPLEMPKANFVWVGTVFYAVLEAKDLPKIRISNEHDGHGWFNLEQAKKLLSWPIYFQNFAAVVAKLPKT
jgi:8-oxo-dGTP pyrophosphatase MutT (NUDIX family)